MDNLAIWENYGSGVWRMKVEGGWIFQTTDDAGGGTVYVPEIDLTRYQSHLRDAYTQGFKDGQSEAIAKFGLPGRNSENSHD